SLGMLLSVLCARPIRAALILAVTGGLLFAAHFLFHGSFELMFHGYLDLLGAPDAFLRYGPSQRTTAYWLLTIHQFLFLILGAILLFTALRLFSREYAETTPATAA